MLRDISLKSKIKEWSFSEVRCAISQSLLWHPRKPDWPYTTHPRKPDWIPIVRVLNSLVNICKTLAVNGIHTNNPVKNIPTFGALLNLFSYQIIVFSLVHIEMGMNLLPVQKQKKNIFTWSLVYSQVLFGRWKFIFRLKLETKMPILGCHWRQYTEIWGWGCQGCGPPPENSNYEINTVRYPKTGPDLHEKQNYP